MNTDIEIGHGPNLFTPMALGPVQVKNRIVFPAVMTGFGSGNQVTDRTIAAYTARAAGGAAMVVSEALAVHPTSAPKSSALVTYGPGSREGFAGIAEAVEREDCRMIGQLYHLGRSQLWTTGSAQPMGPSALPDFYKGTMPRVMSQGDIDMIIEAFAQSAATLARAGFSGVELHAAHGHLLSLFLSPWSNIREDDYGGDETGRTRFLREVVAAIRAAVGPQFAIGLKMPGEEGVRGGILQSDAAALFARIQADTPVDYVCFAQGTIAPSFGDHVPDTHYPTLPFLDLQRELRQKANATPVVAVGKIPSASDAESVLQAGAGDMVALGRALIADPDLPNKAQKGREDLTRPCVYCNACWGEVHGGRPAACPVNPRFGTPGEAQGPSSGVEGAPAAVLASPRRVTVVGGGIAGLEAARTAAARGQQVTLLARHQLGGKTRLESTLPGRADLGRFVAFQETEAQRSGVQVVERGAPASVADILATSPDTVILATGAQMRAPTALALAERTDAVTGICDYAKAPPASHRGTAVIIDQDNSAAVYALAELMAFRHPHTVILTPHMSLAEKVPYTNRLGVHHRLSMDQVEVVIDAAPTRFKAGTLHYENVFTGRHSAITDVGQIVWATPRVPNDTLAEPLRQHGVTVHLVGDAYAPTTMLTAIAQAHAAAESP